MSYYLIRIGEGSKYIEPARKGGYVAIGWEQLPDLSDCNTVDDIRAALEKTTYNYTANQLGQQAGQIDRFVNGMQDGDKVLSPKGSGKYHVGTVGAYYHEARPDDACPFTHRRNVEWHDQVLSKEDFSTNLSFAVGATLTIFSLDGYSDELDALLAGRQATPAEKPTSIRDVVLTGLLELDGREFEEFVKHLLGIMGFMAEVTQYSNDKGIDVTGTLNAEGLAEIKLQVQAKRHQKGSIASRVVREMKGSLGLDEHGCIITTASFSKGAIEEADKQGHKTIRLIDGDDLSALILKNYDRLGDEYKSKFQLRKKKDFNIEEQFEVSNGDEVQTTVIVDDQQVNAPDWDTLVCAAKEDGFQSAFLKQKAWWAVRLNPQTIPFIKYLAMYQVAPISKITYYGAVDRVEPYTGDEWGPKKYKLYLNGDPIKLEQPVGLGERPNLKPQGPKYAWLSKIESATSLDDIWG